MPRLPWIWIARSRTFITMFAATILIAEIDWRAARLPSVSIFLHRRLSDDLVAGLQRK